MSNSTAEVATQDLQAFADAWNRHEPSVGSALLNAALEWSRDAGLKRVDLTVHTTNERALSLYRRLGFEIEGTRRSSLLVSGRYVDEYLMSFINEA